MLIQFKCCKLTMFFTLTFLRSSIEFVSSNLRSGSKTCAVLHSPEPDFHAQSLAIGDGSVLGNIGEEYATASQSWNTSRGYWNVSSGCELTACQTLYLANNCSVFGGSNSSTTPFNHWQSAYCKCNKECKCSDIRFEDAIKIMKNWKKSLKFEPVVFPVKFISINHLAQAIGTKSKHIREASLRLQNSSLSYVAPTPDPKVLEELARAQRENEERMKQLAADKKRKEEQAERERIAAIEVQHERELDRKRLEEQRIREAEELQQKLEEDRLTFLQQQEEERRQAEEAEGRKATQTGT